MIKTLFVILTASSSLFSMQNNNDKDAHDQEMDRYHNFSREFDRENDAREQRAIDNVNEWYRDEPVSQQPDNSDSRDYSDSRDSGSDSGCIIS